MSNVELKNDVANLVRLGNRKINEIRYSSGEGLKHIKAKKDLCESLKREGKDFITEAVLKNGKGVVDVLVLDDALAVEIVDSECDESIECKKKVYPFKIKVLRV